MVFCLAVSVRAHELQESEKEKEKRKKRRHKCRAIRVSTTGKLVVFISGGTTPLVSVAIIQLP